MRSLGQAQTFFKKRFHTHKKAQSAYKRTKIKKAAFYALKNIYGKKSLIRVFVLLMLLVLLLGCVFVLFVLFVRVKSFRKKKRVQNCPNNLIYMTTSSLDYIPLLTSIS